MANFKKEDKASIIARLEVLEKKVEILEAVRTTTWENEKKAVFDTAGLVGNATSVIPGITGTLLPSVQITQAPSPTPAVEVKHKCQTNTCESMETKEYQGKDRKMWLCDTHKF